MFSVFTQSWFVPTVIAVVVTLTLLPFVIILLKSRRRSLKRPVRGTLTIASASAPARGAASANYSLTGVVAGPTIAPTAVQKSGIARSSKWPQPGATLPVEYEDGNPSIFNILWDEAPTGADLGTAASAQLAQTMGAQQQQGSPGFPGQSSGYRPTVDFSQFAGTGAMSGDGAGVAGTLLQSGVAGIGTVITVDAQPGPDGTTTAKLGLQVLPENGQGSFVTTLNIVFRAESGKRRDAWCTPGAQIPIRFDPANTNLVIPDLNRSGA